MGWFEDFLIDIVFESIEKLLGIDMSRPLLDGDVIFVDRGIYLHYGVYIGNNKVIHFAQNNSSEPYIHEITLNGFLIGGECRVIDFPDDNDEDCNYDENIRAIPMRIGNLRKTGILRNSSIVLSMLYDFFNHKDYYIYSGKETVERAKSELNKGGYNLITNNCEHFAIWCKTGIHESKQVENILHIIMNFREKNHPYLI